jgi:hypothetical protein
MIFEIDPELASNNHNLCDLIPILAEDELIDAIIIGRTVEGYKQNLDNYSARVPNYSKIPKGILLSWNEAKGWLDYDMDNYNCLAVYAWTKSKVISIAYYDGHYWPFAVPRNPLAVMPVGQGG